MDGALFSGGSSGRVSGGGADWPGPYRPDKPDSGERRSVAWGCCWVERVCWAVGRPVVLMTAVLEVGGETRGPSWLYVPRLQHQPNPTCPPFPLLLSAPPPLPACPADAPLLPMHSGDTITLRSLGEGGGSA